MDAPRALDDSGPTAAPGAASLDEVAQIERARTDPKAFAAIYRAHYDRMASYLYRRTGDRHETEDLLSELFLAALRGLPRYVDRGAPLRCWLYGIATRVLHRHARRGRRAGIAVAAEAAAPDAGPDALAQREEEDRARRMLDALPRRWRDATALHYLEGLSIEQIAAALGVPPGTVKSRLARARAELRRLLEGDDA